MQNLLMEKLRAYILINNPDIARDLQAAFAFTQYLEEEVNRVQPLLNQLVAEEKPSYIIEELCLNELTAPLRPSRYNYVKGALVEEFPTIYEELVESGIVTHEVLKLIEVCNPVFDQYEFSEDNEYSRFLRYAIIATIHDALP